MNPISKTDSMPLPLQGNDVIRDAPDRSNAETGSDPLPLQLSEITPVQDSVAPSSGFSNIDALMEEIEVDLRIDLGNTCMKLDEFLRLRRGAVITLDQEVMAPAIILANEKIIAYGEILIMSGKFSVRITELPGS